MPRHSSSSARAVATEVGTRLTQAQAADIYDDRWALVHGARVDLSLTRKRTAFEEGFARLQETLRAAIRQAMEDPTFAEVFAQESSIEALWPVTVQTGGRMVTM